MTKQITSTTLFSLLQGFFTDRLMNQRQVSPHTIASYRDSFRLLVDFARQQLKKEPQSLTLSDLDAPLIVAFLNHLEQDRTNGARTRNARLAAVHSFFHYMALHEPTLSALIQRVLAIPSKRFNRRPVEFLVRSEVDALLASPDPNTWQGCRDRTILLLAAQTGLRVSELTGLLCQDIVFGTGAHVHCQGKGRKERCTPLRKDAVNMLHRWLQERKGQDKEPLFPNSRGGFLSRDGVEYILGKYVAVAEKQCPSLKKKRISPHVLRHTAAMDLLCHGVDTAVIALWLGHESQDTVQVYLHADLDLKEKALSKTVSSNVRAGRYRPSDKLLAFLKSL